ncbi:UNVERIFIED_CONTAM: hypothetical protein HDU68_008051 [Siphonaria sp. JEL0065]|nr:hypothetical protein HDU68_008051 [Siphonaria sp. JEL0065]
MTSDHLVYTPQRSLNFPHSEEVYHDLVMVVSVLPESQSMNTLVLDCQNVEYFDYSGVQMLISVKDFLIQHTGYHVPIQFVNLKSQLSNRVMRVDAYDPTRTSTDSVGSIASTLASSPPSSPQSETFSVRSSRSTSLSGSQYRPSFATSLTNSPSIMSLESDTTAVDSMATEDFRPPLIGQYRSLSYSHLQRKHSAPFFSQSYSQQLPANPVLLKNQEPEPKSSRLASFFTRFKSSPSPPSMKRNASVNNLNMQEPGTKSVGPKRSPSLKRFASKLSLTNASFSGAEGVLVVDQDALNHFPMEAAKGLKSIHGK